MKKLALILGIVSLVAACNTIEEPSNIQDKTQEVKQVLNAPVLSASIEEAAETKSYLNEADWKILWTANDEISAFVNRTINWKYRFAGATGDQYGDFTPVNAPEGGSTLTNVYAVYPYNASNSIDANGVLTVNFPAAQTYAAKTFGQGANTMVAAGASESNLVFKNACGFLMFKLYGTNVKVKSVSLKGKNNEKIAGAATVSMPLGGNPTVTMANSATDEIVLTCTNAVTIGNSSSNYTEFWFAVPPVTFTQGFTITVKTDNGGIFFKTANKANFEVERGKAKKMAPFEVKPLTNLSAEETANCYIVNTAGTINPNGYCFDASVAGNGATGVIPGQEGTWYPAAGTYTFTRAVDLNNAIWLVLNENNCVSNVAYNPATKTISFKATGNEGNAKIALCFQATTAIWTWHIWCTDQPGTVSYTNSKGNSFTVMDRNLGATMSSSSELQSVNDIPKLCGLYYQWGRPTPFTGNDTYFGPYNATQEFTFFYPNYLMYNGDNMFMWIWANAMTGPGLAREAFGMLWGNNVNTCTLWKPVSQLQKTIYDPCPPGYQVAPVDFMCDWNDTHYYISETDQWVPRTDFYADPFGVYLVGDNGTVYYPYAGSMWTGGMCSKGDGRARFTGINGGDPDCDGCGFWMWTSGNGNSNTSWHWHLSYNNDSRARYGGTETTGANGRAYSVRCVADDK